MIAKPREVIAVVHKPAVETCRNAAIDPHPAG